MALTSTPGVMSPYTSKASFSTSNQMDMPIPNMMKRPLNGYFRYAMQMRPMIVRQNPNMKITEVAKVLGQKYRQLPTNKKMDMSQTFKTEMEKYQKEFEAFKSTPEGKEVMEKLNQERKEKRLQKFKTGLANLKSEMGRPKQAATSYSLFVTEQSSGKTWSRSEFGAIAKANAEKWKGMTEKQKAPYVQKSKQLSAKYEEDLAKWKAEQDVEGLAKLDAIQKKINATRNDIKGIVPKPKVSKRKKKKVVAKKIKTKKVGAKKAKPKAKKVAAVKKTTKKEPEKAPAKAKRAKGQ